MAGMKYTGITRPVDNLGRIVLPIELRRSLDIGEGDRLEIFVQGDNIVLGKQSSAALSAARRTEICTALVTATSAATVRSGLWI